MTEIIYIPFPKELYDRITIASEGTINPADIAENQVATWMDQSYSDPFGDYWSDDGIEYLSQFYGQSVSQKYGDPERGHQWKELFLPNGTEIRMTYKGRTKYAHIAYENIISENGDSFVSPSNWVNVSADNTSRNAWRDVWIKFPNSKKWQFADDLRRKQKGQSHV